MEMLASGNAKGQDTRPEQEAVNDRQLLSALERHYAERRGREEGSGSVPRTYGRSVTCLVGESMFDGLDLT